MLYIHEIRVAITLGTGDEERDCLCVCVYVKEEERKVERRREGERERKKNSGDGFLCVLRHGLESFPLLLGCLYFGTCSATGAEYFVTFWLDSSREGRIVGLRMGVS